MFFVKLNSEAVAIRVFTYFQNNHNIKKIKCAVRANAYGTSNRSKG